MCGKMCACWQSLFFLVHWCLCCPSVMCFQLHLLFFIVCTTEA